MDKNPSKTSSIFTSDIDYILPASFIAEKPAQTRGESRMMVLTRETGTIEDSIFNVLPSLFNPGDCIILNNTRVLKARILGKRAGGGKAEALLVEKVDERRWKAMVKNSGRLKNGSFIFISDPDGADTTRIKVGEHIDDGLRMLEFERDMSFEDINRIGITPIPPYIAKRREDMNTPLYWDEDDNWYQTVFAQHFGSVAAPTASLHFTDKILDEIKDKGVNIGYVTLHVGPGTFKPIDGDPDDYEIHREKIEITQPTIDLIESTKANGGRVIAIGTTVVRTLETAIMETGGKLAPFSGYSQLFIKPPYDFKVVDAMVTNFHMPRSTLLLLVYAFGGTELLKKAYTNAVNKGYRFYSYGDCMFIR